MLNWCFSFCRADCVEFNESPFFDIYVGPYQPSATPQIPIIQSKPNANDTIINDNDSSLVNNNTEKNDTKIETPKQVNLGSKSTESIVFI